MKRLCLLFLCLLFVFIPSVNAVTIKDYKDDLAELKQKKKKTEENEAKTQAEIDEAKRKIDEISLNIIETTKEKELKEYEINELNKKIEQKEQEIKDLVAFYQISNSENFYLKYIFGADSWADFIYRFSVIEQLTSKNDELVAEMDKLILENETKIKELEDKKIQLDKMEVEVRNQLSKLDNQKSTYSEEGADYDEQIKTLEKQIKTFQSYGCSDYVDLSICMTTAPEDSSFIRPLKHGAVSDNFGPRVSPCDGCSSYHKGMDLAAAEGTAIYAPAAGRVAAMDKYSCGGRTLYINHIVDGRYITTVYMHLLSYNVKVGDIIQQGQKIAEVGGGYRAPDNCTTGAHLHFETVEGHYYGTGKHSYSSYSTYLNSVFDPRKVIWFPAYGVWW